MQCNECGAWFFTTVGITDHNNYCIGYSPEAEEQSIYRSDINDGKR